MKKVDFNRPLVGLDGLEIKEENANVCKIVGNALAQSTKGDALKQWSIATRVYSGEPFELDEADFEMLKAFITNAEGFTVLLKAQLLTMLADQ